MNTRLFADTVVIYPVIPIEGDSGYPAASRGTGVTRSCSVQQDVASRRSDQDGAVLSSDDHAMLFADGSNLPDSADWDIEWTEHDGVAFDTPVLLASLGAAIPPGGLRGRWTVMARRVS